MSKLKVNSTHGGRGPAPSTFDRWVLSVSKRGAVRFRAELADRSIKLVAHKNAPDSARRMLAMAPMRVEAIDDKDAELGEWTFPQASDEPQEPGYIKDEEDSEPERLLKTFAHLLADAHRLSSRQLVEVVQIQSNHFAEERKNLLALQLANERLLAKRLKLPPRMRVLGEGETEEPEGEGEPDEDDSFLTDLLKPMLHRMAGKMVADAAGANGAKTEEKKS